MWILIFLLAITVIVIAVLWSSGVLAESERTRSDSSAIGGETDDDRASEFTESDASVPSRPMSPRRPGSVPPPALAGPAYGQSGGDASRSIPARRSAPPPAATTVGGTPQRADGPSPSTTSERRTSRPPPAASAGSAASASAEGAAPRKRSSAPPPVQAAWSTPDAKSEREPD